MDLPFPLILASSSPRRSQLLLEAGISFEVRHPRAGEDWPEGMEPERIPAFLAEKKAASVLSGSLPGELILSADTLVFLEGRVLGKPVDTPGAIRMLEALSGRMHQVITGVCLFRGDQKILFTETTEVWFRSLEQEEILDYVFREQPLDKAGAYGIQERIGILGIEKIRGSFYNVMGLPVSQVVRALRGMAGKIP